jgi:hypothetical protein
MVAKLGDVKAKVEDYRKKILDGSFEVCDALNPTPVCDKVKGK